jgi:pimeloyl-ACP methyl ester carboxylesterase
MIMKRLFFQGTDDLKYCGILNIVKEDSPIAVLVHGLSSSKDSSTNIELEKVLLANGISVFRFDLFGHGESHGDFADLTHSKGIDSTLAALDFIRSQGHTKIGLVGSSFGGFSSVRAAARTEVPLKFLSLKSPVVTDVTRIFGILFKDMMPNWETDGYIEFDSPQGDRKRLNYTFYQDAVQYVGYEFAKDIKIPTFIVHGTADEIVPFDQSSGLADTLPDCELVPMDGADHRYLNPKHFKNMIQHISSFVIGQFTV